MTADVALQMYYADLVKDYGTQIGASVFMDWLFARTPEGEFALLLRPRAGAGTNYLMLEGTLKARFGSIYLVSGMQYLKNSETLGWHKNTEYVLADELFTQSLFIVAGAGFTVGDFIAEFQYRAQVEPGVQLIVYPGELWNFPDTRRLAPSRYNTVALSLGWMFTL